MPKLKSDMRGLVAHMKGLQKEELAALYNTSRLKRTKKRKRKKTKKRVKKRRMSKKMKESMTKLIHLMFLMMSVPL